MTSSHISSKLATPVSAAFRRHCHRFLAIGFHEALSRILSEPDEETDITGYICEGLEAWFRHNPQRSVGFFIKDDPPLGGNGRTGKRRPRTDIGLTSSSVTRRGFVLSSSLKQSGSIEGRQLHRAIRVPGAWVVSSVVVTQAATRRPR